MEKYNPFKRELLFHQDVMPKIEGLLLSVDDNATLSEKYVGVCFCDFKVYKQRVSERFASLTTAHSQNMFCSKSFRAVNF